MLPGRLFGPNFGFHSSSDALGRNYSAQLITETAIIVNLTDREQYLPNPRKPHENFLDILDEKRGELPDTL
jgi:hypothetical protein